jgi:hypothetical protein
MAQTSTTIASSKSHKVDISGSVISFTKTGTEYKISSSSVSTVSFGNLSQFDLVTISGTTNNNGTFTVKSVASDGSYLIVEEEVVTENSDGSTTVTLDYVGFVTDKQKGDGYYSQVDGIHTVAYHVSAGSNTAANNFDGKIKIQGSLATTPTEDDWFDVDNTTFTADLSTKVASFNFTGNFVWIRAKAFDQTNSASSVTKILYNH